MIIEKEIVIDTSLDNVFSFFIDTDNLQKWLGGLKEINILKGDEPRVGAETSQVIEQSGQKLHFIQTITGFEENQLFEAEMVAKEMEMITRHEFSEENGKTQILISYDIQLKSFLFRSVKKLVKAMMEKSIEEDFNRLKSLLENE